MFAILLGFGLICTAALVAAIYDPQDVDTAPTIDRGVTRLACTCAVSEDDVAYVLNAYQRNDPQALYGLVTRQKALMLDQGVRVDVILREHGMADVAINSGFHAGQRCWLPETFIDYSQ